MCYGTHSLTFLDELIRVGIFEQIKICCHKWCVSVGPGQVSFDRFEITLDT